ncbi:MAG: hypothetical protein HC866_12595 [Leptolyngbyaceae cyanobacterium RU_5_1]|nr:hypothetical protein [Leptolyngbyaceae cyanobacterium RU_5_1]
MATQVETLQNSLEAAVQPTLSQPEPFISVIEHLHRRLQQLETVSVRQQFAS